MNSNIYRFSTLGEMLCSTLRELQSQSGVSDETCELVRLKFDQIANKHINEIVPPKDQERLLNNPAHISGIETEFKFTDGNIIRGLEACS